MQIQKINDVDLRLRRFVALLIDILLIYALGAIVGFIFRSWLIELGTKAYLIGFVIALLYHGLTNSLLMAGQTIGKIIVRLKVVTKSGNRTGLFRSLTRSILIVNCFFSASFSIPYIWSEALTYVMTPFFVGLPYFLIVTSGNRSVHDILCGTYVIGIDSGDFIKYKISSKNLIVVALFSIIILLFGEFILSSKVEIDRSFAESIKKTHAQIISLPDVQGAKIQLEGDKYTIAIQTTKPPIESHKLAVKAACSLINNLELSDSAQVVRTTILRGFDMKIFRSWEVYDNSLSVHDWLFQCSKYNI